MPYYLLKITGPHLMHGKLPGEEFYVRVGDTGAPTNPLWAKRLADEQRDRIGALTIVGTVDELPSGFAAVGEAEAPAAPHALPPRGPNTDALKTEILESVARALAGIRKEIPAPIDTGDLMARVKQEIDKSTAAAARSLNEERVRVALINDAWRVRMNLPTDWKVGDHVNFLSPPVIEAYAARHHNGDIGDAAMVLTKQDEEWQEKAGEALRGMPVVSGPSNRFT